MRLGADACRERFAGARHAYLATTGADSRPHVVPVTFVVLPLGHAAARDRAYDEIVTVVDGKPKTTTALRRLRNVMENPRVAVLVDEYDDDWSRLWWVRADGEAGVEPAPPPDVVDALAARYPPYLTTPPSGPALRIAVDRWTGWAARG